jgi:hypothetical protein
MLKNELEYIYLIKFNPRLVGRRTKKANVGHGWIGKV